jgi:TolA-binding protein
MNNIFKILSILLFISIIIACSPVRSSNANKRYSAAKPQPTQEKQKQNEKPAKTEKQEKTQKPIEPDNSVNKEYYKLIEQSNKKNNGKSDSSHSKSSMEPKYERGEKPMLSMKMRFSDTTVIEIDADVKSTKTENIQKRFESALSDFDKDNYDKACQDAQVFAESFSEGDSLYFEAQFLWSECMIVKNDIEGAKKVLNQIYKDENTPQNIFEKVLVRLGQAYCADGKESEANKLFSRLKKEYPKSIYIKLATCDAVNK